MGLKSNSLVLYRACSLFFLKRLSIIQVSLIMENKYKILKNPRQENFWNEKNHAIFDFQKKNEKKFFPLKFSQNNHQEKF